MPEGLEAEIWRRASLDIVGREICDLWFDERVVGGVNVVPLDRLLIGRRIDAVRRRGKVLLVDTDGPTLGLHFGMTGRLVVDGKAPIAKLEYASGADRSEWDRLRLFTLGSDMPALRLNDPRRLGRLTIDPDLGGLGPDFLTISADDVGAAASNRRVAVKTLLLDQHAIAGLGNLCADEVLFWSGVAPSRPVHQLLADDLAALASACRERLGHMLDNGGSTSGLLTPAVRTALPPCPLDGGQLERSKISGRTSVWCTLHQR